MIMQPAPSNTYRGWHLGVGVLLLAMVAVMAMHHLHERIADKVLVVVEDVVDSANEGRLVHVSGLARSDEVLRDPVLGVQVPAIALVREVEMYQWQEKPETIAQRQRRRSGNQTVKLVYRPVWADQLIDSSAFADPDLYGNPAFMPILSETRYAERVTVGDFRLSKPLIAQIPYTEAFSLRRAHLIHLPKQIHERVNDQQPDWLYIGDPLMPEIGDLRIRLHIVPDQVVSIIAGQSGDGLVPHGEMGTDPVSYLVGGEVGVKQMLSGSGPVRQLRQQ